MISRIHSKLGTAGLVVAIVALVVALTGVAVAASGLNGKQKKEVKSIAKQFAGKNGAPGAQGPKGDTGAAGSAGKNGADGAPGANGKNVVLTAEPAGVNCKNAGTKVEVEGNAASKKYVCNGQTGFTDTLPSGKTETGTWAVGTGNSGAMIVPLSFNIPLATAPEALHFVSEDGKEHTEEVVVETPVNCKGSAEEPTALPGQVCVYEGLNIGAGGYLANEALTNLLPAGATFFYLVQAEQAAFGSWAVTAK
jgi:hypothetical protein